MTDETAPDMRDTIARIVRENVDFDHPDQGHFLRAADAIIAALPHRDLVEALRPFARQRPHKSEAGEHGILVPATVADVRRAHDVLAKFG